VSSLLDYAFGVRDIPFAPVFPSSLLRILGRPFVPAPLFPLTPDVGNALPLPFLARPAPVGVNPYFRNTDAAVGLFFPYLKNPASCVRACGVVLLALIGATSSSSGTSIYSCGARRRAPPLGFMA
jgi:hypothetical protein